MELKIFWMIAFLSSSALAKDLTKEMACYNKIKLHGSQSCLEKNMQQAGFGGDINSWKLKAKVHSLDTSTGEDVLLIKQDNSLLVFAPTGIYTYTLPSRRSNEKYPFIVPSLKVPMSQNRTEELTVLIVDDKKMLRLEDAAIAALEELEKNPLMQLAGWIESLIDKKSRIDLTAGQRISKQTLLDYANPVRQVRFDLESSDPILNDHSLRLSQLPANLRIHLPEARPALSDQTRGLLAKIISTQIQCVSEQQANALSEIRQKKRKKELLFVDLALSALDSCRGLFGQETEAIIAEQTRKTVAIGKTATSLSPTGVAH